MSEKCQLSGKKANCDHNCQRMSEGVVSKSGIIYARCQNCGHTVDVGMILGRELKLYIGVVNFWEGNRMFFKFSEVPA